jgi:hypothetical protein
MTKMKIATTARKLKVTAVIDAAPFVELRNIPDTAPSRTELIITVDGRPISADLATKSVRKAVKTLTESGADNVVLLIQGTLTAGNRIEEAGLVANVKAAAAVK